MVTVRGPITSNWTIGADGTLDLVVVIPPNVLADFQMPIGYSLAPDNGRRIQTGVTHLRLVPN
jgi:hypothetical protein